MIIRKEFRVESAHIVRNCTSERCSHSVHGHSAVIEVMLESDTLDNAGMVYDFGLMKNTIKQLVDSTDHCYLLWDQDKPEFREFIKKECARWVELPFNPSAEQLSMFYMVFIQNILNHTVMSNGEHHVKVHSVRYHETTTGWAECNRHDLAILWSPDWNKKIKFSEGVMKDWGEDLANILLEDKIITNPYIEPQVVVED